jgi:hypothetical protein
MADSDHLLQRNKDPGATCARDEASIIARRQVYVIPCLDPRTDPSAYDGSFTLPAEVMAGREAAPPPGPSRAEVARRQA